MKIINLWDFCYKDEIKYNIKVKFIYTYCYCTIINIIFIFIICNIDYIDNL